jgi:predicted RNA-binding Zn-ribbon protein involved in translation (DUF1610 family)
MSKSLRRSEIWFNRGLWVVAVVFAGFLAGLGGVIVGDLPRVEQTLRRDTFLDQGAARPLRETIAAAKRAEAAADGKLEQAQLRLRAIQQAYTSGRESFENWIDTRKATGLPSQDKELVARTQALDALKVEEDAGQRAADLQQEAKLDADQAQAAAEQKLDELNAAADERLATAESSAELRVFLYRLALTLPLLGIAGWLLAKRRNSVWWPFVWGFILFALYGFFVELVPYLPSYGGYVHYIVGIVTTVLVGRYVIVALNRYLAQSRLAEQQPDKLRRETLAYDTTLVRLSKGVCPSCERKVDLGNIENDFCPYCGIGLFDHCTACLKRKSTFAQFCHACGIPAQADANPGATPILHSAS